MNLESGKRFLHGSTQLKPVAIQMDASVKVYSQSSKKLWHYDQKSNYKTLRKKKSELNVVEKLAIVDKVTQKI